MTKLELMLSALIAATLAGSVWACTTRGGQDSTSQHGTQSERQNISPSQVYAASIAQGGAAPSISEPRLRVERSYAVFFDDAADADLAQFVAGPRIAIDRRGRWYRIELAPDSIERARFVANPSALGITPTASSKISAPTIQGYTFVQAAPTGLQAPRHVGIWTSNMDASSILAAFSGDELPKQLATFPYKLQAISALVDVHGWSTMIDVVSAPMATKPQVTIHNLTWIP